MRSLVRGKHVYVCVHILQVPHSPSERSLPIEARRFLLHVMGSCCRAWPSCARARVKRVRSLRLLKDSCPGQSASLTSPRRCNWSSESRSTAPVSACSLGQGWPPQQPQRISGLVAEYIVAIDVTRVRFPADALLIQCCLLGRGHRSITRLQSWFPQDVSSAGLPVCAQARQRRRLACRKRAVAVHISLQKPRRSCMCCRRSWASGYSAVGSAWVS